MTYAWIIDKDHTANEGDEPGTNMNAVGIMGPRDAPDEYLEWLKAGTSDLPVAGGVGLTVLHFRMYDDDGELYYTGRYISNDGEPEFGPLDDYGAPNAGATHIEFKNAKGEWEEL